MLDFFKISTRSTKRGVIEIYPKFLIKKSSDLMIRGGDFYAIWVEEKRLWSTDEQDALQMIDRELDIYAREHVEELGDAIKVLHMWDAESGLVDVWHKYCQKQMRDDFHMLDEKLIFSNMETTKEDYASKKLDYPLEAGDLSAYNKLMNTLYSESERHKIEWAIGSIVTGDSKTLQKFMVLYGSAGTGKSTVLNIIQMLFHGYYSTFDAKALGSSNNAFALEAFRTNPLVAIQQDGDLSRIEDNTRLNSLVAHETMLVNEKFTKQYTSQFKCFLFMGTNKPVKITDAKSGIIRRLVDVSPTGDILPYDEYVRVTEQVKFELGAIAWHCKEVYLEDPNVYNNYVPKTMLGASNDFYNFILDSYFVFERENKTTLKAAWEMYKTYCEEARVNYPYSQRLFKEELKNYFYEFKERSTMPDGSRLRNYYFGFKTALFEDNKPRSEDKPPLIIFEEQASMFDSMAADCCAQYANEEGKPSKRWDNVKTTLSELDTSKLHYVKVPENHIVIDFDIPGEDGSKSYEKNLEAASEWPPTYAELSKSGAGIHLHYIYAGDPSRLSMVYDKNIEIKVFKGGASLRRKLTKCNNLPIATISSGLPLKGDRKVVSAKTIEDDRHLHSLIKKALRKEIAPGATKPSIDFIVQILNEAYESGIDYDVTDLRGDIFAFAANSTHNAEYCTQQMSKMRFTSKTEFVNDILDSGESPIVFYDVEVFPNLFLVNWKVRGKPGPCVRMINPSPQDIEQLIKMKLVGFNNRRYDNHMLYARMLGYSEKQLFELSQQIIFNHTGFFGKAYELSYTDVFDFCSTKQSLKKWEIALGIHHKELGIPWDQPVPEERWIEVAEYCDNDVFATEAVFDFCEADFKAREILAELAGMSVNTPTNTLTTRIIFGNDKHPQDRFNYRNLAEKPVDGNSFCYKDDLSKVPKDAVPYFPGYEYKYDETRKKFISTYRGEEVGEGGYVYAETGIHYNVALDDIASMHPSSLVDENLFGDEYTDRFHALLNIRLSIKHKKYEDAKSLLEWLVRKPGLGDKYLSDESDAKELSKALKIVINSVYGLTAASFDNAFRDIRNKDNIVAKRGALFMVDLKHAVQKKGFTVAHIKTDSIKIPDATPEIIKFVEDFGKLYGYSFELEATYDRMCLVNDAVYIAKYKDGGWTATGTQFQVPYVFKTLFSHEPIEFKDMCETKSVSSDSALYLDMNEDLPDVSKLEKELAKLKKNDGDPELIKDYESKIESGHNYIFVGRVGSFCPIKSGHGGGRLMRFKDGKYFAAGGTKDWRWLEAETVTTLGKEDDIDLDYYRKLVDEAVVDISQYGDFDNFANGEVFELPF